MYDTYIVTRTQIYLDDDQHRRLAQRARAAGTTKSELIRRAVDAYLSGPLDDRGRLLAFRAAVQAAAGAAERLPPGREYVDDIRRADVERLVELTARPRR